MPNNKILTSANAALKVTNLAAAGGAGQTSGTQTLEGVPVGTADGSATGELAVKVMTVGSGGSGTLAQRVQGANTVTDVTTSDPVQIGGLNASSQVTAIITTAAGAVYTATSVAAAAALASKAYSGSNQTLAAANTARRGLLLFNNTDGNLFVKFGATATATTSFTIKLLPGSLYEMPQPIYTGIVDGIGTSGTAGSTLVTEIT